MKLKGFHVHLSGAKIALQGWIDLDYVTLEG